MNTDYNYLTPNGFRLLIDDKNWSDLEYHVTDTTLPAINFGENSTPYQNQQGYVPGDTIVFDPFQVTFIVDENMKTYFSLYQWMLDLRENHLNEVKDIILFIYTNHNNVNKRLKFTNAFPTALSELAFATTGSDVQYLTATTTFRYDYYYIEK
jgi:hypothetical protein